MLTFSIYLYQSKGTLCLLFLSIYTKAKTYYTYFFYLFYPKIKAHYIYSNP